MLEELLKYLANKKILILGYGKEGKSTYKFIRKHFPEIKLYVADKKETIIEENEELSEDTAKEKANKTLDQFAESASAISKFKM